MNTTGSGFASSGNQINLSRFGALAVFYAAWAFSEGYPAAASSVFDVYNVSDLRAALAAASDTGGIIRLAPGAYGDLRIANRHFRHQLVLISATGEPPTFASVNLTGSSNIAIAGVRVSGSAQPLVQLSKSRDILFAHNHVTGINQNQDAWDDGNTALHVRFATRIVVLNNLFEDLKTAAFSQQSSAVAFELNTVRFVREGLNVAATDDLSIANNHFHSFQPNVPKGEHPDAIQFWTSRESRGSSNVRITENAMVLGGCKAVQGIFIRSETEGKTTVAQIRHSNFAIRRNVYYGSARHGITVSSVDGASIENNVVVGSPYAFTGIKRAAVTDPRCSGALVPGILTTNGSSSHRLARNITHILGKTEGVRTDDVSIGSDPEDLPWTAALAKQPTAEVPTLTDFTTRNPSLLRARGVGLLDSFPHGVQDWPTAASYQRGLRILRSMPAQ